MTEILKSFSGLANVSVIGIKKSQSLSGHLQAKCIKSQM